MFSSQSPMLTWPCAVATCFRGVFCMRTMTQAISTHGQCPRGWLSCLNDCRRIFIGHLSGPNRRLMN